MYKKVVSYYFSGTGNSRNVAKWFAETAAERSIPVQEFSITAIDGLPAKPEPDDLIVFCSPVHGFNFPPVMLNFLAHFPRGNCNAALMNTRGGTKLGNYNVPGLSGIAFYLAALMLILKGYRIKAMYPVNLPSNWMSLHPVLSEETVKFLHEKNKARVITFAHKILDGKTDFRSLKELIQDILIAPVAVLYYFIGRFMLAKTFFASGDCNDCDACVKNCPVHAIKKVDNRPYWSFTCESCMKCMSGCPKRAIETAHGFIIGAMVFFNSVVMYYFYTVFKNLFFEINNEAVKFIIEPLICIFLLGISYRIIHYCMRFRFMERIMVYTSLTKYKFWGSRYRALRNF